MSLSPGTRFGPYEIADQIGAGGMGVVYRATDTTLDREVAIKVLPEAMASDAERIARFDREAKTLASLNHPNIAQIHGLEKADGTTAIIMELVEGPTLADRIEKGPLSADEALGIAMQIAEALEAAHRQNIVHRDLKPANIKLRSDGTVKVLDFGIAKALDIRATSGLSPVMATPTVTQTGIILGTAAYMSPEQARGKGVDERTDIWAFGCLLFEMLTGQPAFGGEEATVTLARILERDPDMDSLPASVSPAVSHTIKLCLQKDVRKRVADIRDVKLSVEGEFAPEVAAGTADRRAALPLVGGASLVAGVLVTAVVWSFWPTPEPPSVTRFAYELPDGQTILGLTGPMLTISPDGRRFVYSTDDGLYVREMDKLEARLIPGAESIGDVFAFSPDGQSVAGSSFPGRLTRMAIIGGAPVPLADLRADAGLYGLSWQTDGTILYTLRGGIYRIAANGGMPEPLIPFDGVNPDGVELLPDGDSVLFSVTDTEDWDSAQIVVQSLSTGGRTELGLSGSDARYLPTYLSTGHIVYALGSQLFAAPFDPETLRVSGGPVPVLQEVIRAEGGLSGLAHYDVSDNGTLIYLSGDIRPDFARTLVWVDREGREEPIDAPPRSYRSPRISPDRTKVALSVRDNQAEGGVWTWDLARRTLTPVAADPGLSRYPVWLRDSRRIAFVWRPPTGGTASSLFWRAADGTGSNVPLAQTAYQLFPASLLPDGTGLAVSGDITGVNNADIAVVRLEGGEAVEEGLATPSNEGHPEVSPNGRWLAYTSDESENDQVWVRPFPNVEAGRWQISTDGGEQPLWAPDGSELFYRNGDALMAVQIETDPSFDPGTPEVLFEGYPVIIQGGRDYDTFDAERFLMMKQVEDRSVSAEILVVENWFEELRRMAPAD